MALKLGELLVQKKLLSKEGVEKGLQAQRMFGGKLGTNLVELGLIKDTQLASVLAQQLNVQAANPKEFDAIPRKVLEIISVEFAREHKIIPLSTEPKLRVAISDPRDLEAIDQLRFKIGKPIQVVVAPEIWIVAALERCYNIARETRYVRMGEAAEETSLITYDISTDTTVDYEGKYKEELRIVPLPDFLDRLSKAEKKEEVVNALFAFLGPLFPCMAVYVVKKDGFAGWMVRGFAVHGRDFAEIRAATVDGSILQGVSEHGAEFVGRIPPTEANQASFGILKIPSQKTVGVFPIHLRGKTIAMLLGLPSADLSVSADDSKKLAKLACTRAGLALEVVALKQQILYVPGKEA